MFADVMIYPRYARRHYAQVRENADALLARELGTRQLAASIFNYTVGSGIFALPAFAVAQLGTAAPLAWFTCMLVIGLVVLCFAEAGSRVSMTGGPYAYVEVALGPFVGFVAGVLLFVVGLGAGAAVTTIFVGSVLKLIPGAPAWVASVVMVLVILTMVFINVRGVKSGARVIEVVTVLKLIPLLAFVIIGAFFIEPANLTIEHVPPMSSVLGTAGIVIFAFSGVESALTPSGEVRTPARTVPRAAFLALGAATALYLAIQWVALGIKGLSLANDSIAPLADAASVFGGPVARTVMIVGAIISTFGYLSSNVLSIPRCLFAFGRDGFIPRVFSAVHAVHRTPHIAIVTYGVGLAVFALSGTFAQLAVLSNLAALVLYFLCAIAVWVLRKRDVRTDGKPFVLPGGPLIPIATCLAIAWLFYETVGVREWIALGIVMLVALILYGIRRSRSARVPS
jgi:basic amino acid/polyamine antiporter, APA family